jgi:hypothetical protein
MVPKLGHNSLIIEEGACFEAVCAVKSYSVETSPAVNS